MLNMHLPEGAVRHKMSASGFTDQEIDSFLGGGGGDTSSSNGSIPHACLENITSSSHNTCTRRSSFCEIHENASNAFTDGCNQTQDVGIWIYRCRD